MGESGIDNRRVCSNGCAVRIRKNMANRFWSPARSDLNERAVGGLNFPGLEVACPINWYAEKKSAAKRGELAAS